MKVERIVFEYYVFTPTSTRSPYFLFALKLSYYLVVPAYCHYELFQKQNYKPLACKQISAHLSCSMISFQKSLSSMLPGSSTCPVAGTECQTDFCHWFASVLSREIPTFSSLFRCLSNAGYSREVVMFKCLT